MPLFGCKGEWSVVLVVAALQQARGNAASYVCVARRGCGFDVGVARGSCGLDVGVTRSRGCDVGVARGSCVLDVDVTRGGFGSETGRRGLSAWPDTSAVLVVAAMRQAWPEVATAVIMAWPCGPMRLWL